MFYQYCILCAYEWKYIQDIQHFINKIQLIKLLLKEQEIGSIVKHQWFPRHVDLRALPLRE